MPETPHDPNAKPGQHGFMGSTYKSPYGFVDGLAERLTWWAKMLATDKTLPWKGLGLILDLQRAAESLGGELMPSAVLTYDIMAHARAEISASLAQKPVDVAFKRESTPSPEPELEDWEKAIAPAREYDL